MNKFLMLGFIFKLANKIAIIHITMPMLLKGRFVHYTLTMFTNEVISKTKALVNSK
jgi:hypothetical protein